MAKAPLHKLCGTAHWSTESCPAMKAARASSAVQPVPAKPTPAQAEAAQRTTIREAVQASGGKLPSLTDAILIDAAEKQASVPKRTKKPAKAKKPKPGSRVTKPRAAKATARASPGRASGKAALSSNPTDPKKMSVPDLIAYVTADLKRKAAAKKAKAEAQARWRGKQ